MTKSKIEKMAFEIKSFLDENYLNGDCRIYFNGKCLDHGSEDDSMTWDPILKDYIDEPDRKPWRLIENICPKDYFDYTSDILCMSFEGSFYDVMNAYSKSSFKKLDEFHKLLKKYGCYSELGNSWNLAVFEN